MSIQNQSDTYLVDKVVPCNKCGSKDTKKGAIKYVGINLDKKVQLYKCKACGNSFREDRPFWKIRHNKETIELACELLRSKMPVRQIIVEVKKKLRVDVSPAALSNWKKRFKEAQPPKFTKQAAARRILESFQKDIKSLSINAEIPEEYASEGLDYLLLLCEMPDGYIQKFREMKQRIKVNEDKIMAIKNENREIEMELSLTPALPYIKEVTEN